MTSGIYKLTFNNGYYYIGKSKDIQRRWKEHWIKFEKGTAARSMQEAFNQCGYPSQEILYEVHPDHLDVVEPIAIHNHWGPKILNTTRETPCTELKESHLPLCEHSLAEICNGLQKSLADVEEAQQKLKLAISRHSQSLRDIKNGTLLKRLEESIEAYKKLAYDRDVEITRLKSRGLIDRIMNW